MKKYYLTSAIPYVNAAPHIGHAQEFVYADVVRRYHLLRKENVFYVCGADENALKIVQAAQQAGKNPKDFCDENQEKFLALANKLNVEFDAWQRGTSKNHFTSSQELWRLCRKNGDIYKKSYSGLYCIGCEAFYTSEELDQNGECLEHPGRKLEKVEEENYFFRLSKYQDFLENLIRTDKLKVIPEIRKKEALSFIGGGLEDFSISRSVTRAKNWGVPVPDDPSQIMYVWFDALNIYQSAIGFGSNNELYNAWRPQDVMIIGKGILRFHAIYWPAILQSSGLPLPKSLFVHGYLTVDGQKMSKTVGNVIDPNTYIHTYGSDAVRYYLLREIPSYDDGDFSQRRFKEVYNADLANGLGNLVSRIAKLCELKNVLIPNESHIPLSSEIGGIENHMERFEFHLALEKLWRGIKSLDIEINTDKPWESSDTSKLVDYVKKIKHIAYALQPFLPHTSQKILQQFSAQSIVSQKPLFPRIP